MKNLLAFSFLFAAPLITYCQTTDEEPNTKTSLLPIAGSESPRANSANGFESVDYFTGRANIAVPIYSKSYGSVDVNVGVAYTSSGNQVLTFPGEIGLGWNLSTGFSLTRIVNGVADDELDQGNLYIMDYVAHATSPADCQQRMTGYLRNTSPVSLTEQSTGTDIKAYYISNHDPEQDIFSCTLNGKSKKFVIGKNGEIFFLSPCDWKISYSYNSQYQFQVFAPNSFIDKFMVTDENGNKYRFNAGSSYTTSTSIPTCANEISCPDIVTVVADGTREPISDWPIEKITTYNGLEILFNYFTKLSTDNQPIREVRYAGQPAFCSVVIGTSQYCYQYPLYGGTPVKYINTFKPYLESIVMPDGVALQFLYDNKAREDAFYIPSQNNVKSLALSEIRLKRNSNPTTFYNFYHSYFAHNGTVSYYNTGGPSWGNNLSLRLKLDSIIVSPNDQKLGYRFDYEIDKRLPSRHFPQIDHWGYFKQNYNQNLLHGDRSADSSVVYANMLKKITFGDKSSVEYQFESNIGKQFDFYTGLESNATIGGGVRVRAIKTYDGISHNNDIVRRFDYRLDNGTTSGILFSEPDYKKPFECYVHGACEIATLYSMVNAWGYTKNGSPIGYSKVTVYNGNSGEGGKEIYDFTNLVDAGGIVNLIPGRSTALPRPNFQYLADWNIGLLKTKKTFNSSSTLVKQEDYEYTSGYTQPDASVLPSFKSIKYDIKKGAPVGLSALTCSENIPWDYYKAEYYPVKGYALPAKKTITDYLSGTPVVTATQYTYDNNYKIQKELTKGSDGKFIEKRYYRVYDFSNPGVAANYLTAGNRKNEILRIDNLIKDDINAPYKYLSSVIYSYDNVLVDIANSIYRVEPKDVYKLIADQPISESLLGPTTNMSRPMPAANVPYYFKDVSYSYNSLGLVNGISREGHNTAVLNDTYDVIATAKNAEEKNIAYTSFENNKDAQGGWFLETLDFANEGFSGTHSAAFSRNPIVLLKALDPTVTYVVSMWCKNGSPVIHFNTGAPLPLVATPGSTATGWVYYSGTFTGKSSCNIPSGSQVDEIRLYPQGSAMKTYTHQPLSGITSECGEQNNLINYTYDFMGRLIEVSDKDNKIIKQYRYGIGTQN